MPEWITTDNVAIVVLIVGNIAQWRQWTADRRESRQREISMLTDANDRDRGYMVRMDESTAATTSILRAQSAMRKTIEALAQKMEVEMRHQRLAIQSLRESAPP